MKTCEREDGFRTYLATCTINSLEMALQKIESSNQPEYRIMVTGEALMFEALRKMIEQAEELRNLRTAANSTFACLHQTPPEHIS
jgi:hypothetical protein